MNTTADNSPNSDSSELFNRYQHNRFVIFLHVQKTAGLTVQRYLRERFGPSLIKRTIWRLTRNARLSGAIIEAAKARTIQDGFFAGHFCFGMHRYLPKPATYMVFLRDPVSRIRSLYWYSREAPDAYYHEHAKRVSFHEFVTQSGLMELDNGMVRFLAGSEDDTFINRAPLGSVDRAMLNQAIHNMDRFCFFIGTQEKFNASFLLLAKKLGDPSPRYLTLNEAKKSRDRKVTEDTVEAIKKSNKYDIELYEYAKQKLNAEIAKEFPNIEQDLIALERRNAAYANELASGHSILSKIKRP